MAKSKRKISSTQRDKIAIAQAKALKAAGILSKQTKLHGGKYISQGVLRKVREYGASANLGYKAHTVTKEMAKAAKERGFQVVQGNKIIGPSTPTFRKRLASGALTGVIPIRGGMMEEVILPHSVYDFRTMLAQLGEGIDTLKNPEEWFAFRYHGAMSLRPFPNTQSLLDYLTHYKSVELINTMRPEDLVEEFRNISIIRLHPADQSQFIPRRSERQRMKREAIARGEIQPRKRAEYFNKKRAERIAGMSERTLERFRKKEAAKSKAKRDKLTKKEKEEYRRKARERAKRWRDAKKGQ